MDVAEQANPTSRSLLRRLREGPGDADWVRFEGLYGPLIYSWARRRGLDADDADDLTQEVLVALVRSVALWDADRGPFRGWLWTVTKNKVRDFQRVERRRERGSGDSGVRRLLDGIEGRDEEARQQWDREYENELLSAALRVLRPDFAEKTWRAFEMIVVEEQSPTDVAAQLGMKLHSVYMAKSRILTRLRQELDGLLNV